MKYDNATVRLGRDVFQKIETKKNQFFFAGLLALA
jgi:hypothetical protein